MSREPSVSDQRRILVTVLALNLLLVGLLTAAGVRAESNGLIANALDNASDSAVYVISLFAVSRSPRWKRATAAASGVLLLVFAIGVVADAVRRYLVGSEPVGPIMMGAAVIAGAVNLLCLVLLKRLGRSDVNVRAAETFSTNDFIASGGVLVAGGLVAWTDQPWPDLLVGVAVSAVAVKGGIEILRDARDAKRAEGTHGGANA